MDNVGADPREIKAAIARAKRLARAREASANVTNAQPPGEGSGGPAETPPLGISTHNISRGAFRRLPVPLREGCRKPERLGVQLWTGGVRVQGVDVPGNPTGKGGRKRGKVQGWSAASRRRMRELLLTHELREGYHCLGLTLTLPGPGFDSAGVERLWHSFSDRWPRAGGCAIWRREVQERGADHWHCLAGLQGERRTAEERAVKEWLLTLRSLGHTVFPGGWFVRKEGLGGVLPRAALEGVGCSVSVPGTECRVGDWGFLGWIGAVENVQGADWQTVRLMFWGGQREVRMRGADALQGLTGAFTGDIEHVRLKGERSEYWGEVVCNVRQVASLPGWPENWTGEAVRGYPDLSKWPGAEEKACEAELQEVKGAWLRYLQDHATKGKQVQVLKPGCGRHWGVINRAGFREGSPLGVVDFGELGDAEAESAFRRFLRCLDRLRTPKCLSARHDGRRRWKVKSSTRGSRVYFTATATAERLALWAKGQLPARERRLPG